MVTMIDEHFDRAYQSSRTDLNATFSDMFGRLGSAVGNSFRVLNRIEYSAPWTVGLKRARCN